MMRRLDLTDNERAVLITTLRRLVDFHQVVSFKSPADTPAMPGMLRKSTASVPRYQKFESISLQRRVHCEPDFSHARSRLKDETNYRCSLGTNTALGLVANGLLAVLPAGGAETGKCSVVMPGHIGTSIPINSRKIQSGNQSDAMDATQIAQARARIASTGRDVSDLSDATRETRRKRSFGDKDQISVQTPKAIVEDARCLLSGGNVFHAIFVTERSSTLPIA
jgi:hypothetical protein